jgi:hypothetical protein
MFDPLPQEKSNNKQLDKASLGLAVGQYDLAMPKQ